jgi:hypothetical protein
MIAIEMLKAILAGRSWVRPLRLEDVVDNLDEWVRMAYLIADKCIAISTKVAR